MGDDAAKRESTPEELARMQSLLRSAMGAGAIGFASSTNANHRGAGGVPIASRWASDEETRALAAVLAEFDHGVYEENCGGGERHSIEWIEEISNISGKPALYAPHYHFPAVPDKAAAIM